MTIVRRKTWWITLLCALAALGLAAAFGAGVARGEDGSPTPAAKDKSVLKIGWMGDIDNLNPLIGWTNNVYEVYAQEYLLMVGRDWETLKPNDSGIAKSWEVSDDGLVWTFTMNEGMTWHDGVPITAKDAAFTYNFIVENQIAAYASFVAGIERVEAVDDLTYKVTCSRARRQHAHALDPLPARAHLGQDERQGGEPDLPERPALHRQRPLQGRRVEEGALPAHGGLQGLLPRRADGRRAHLRRLPERRHHGPGPEGRHARRRLSLPAGAVRAAQSDRRHRGDRVQLVQLGLRRVQLLRRRVQGQPGPARQGLPGRPGMGGGPRQDGRAGLRRPCLARLHLHAAGELE